MIFYLKSMGYGSQIRHMIFIIFLVIPLDMSSHILIADALLDLAEDFRNVQGLQQLYSMEESLGNQNKIEKVSGQDENEQMEGLIVQKFRALLGLKSTKRRTPLKGAIECPSTSPNRDAEASIPVPVPALAPAPTTPNLAHFRPPPPRTSTMPLAHRIHKENTGKGRVARVLVPVLVSAGAAFLACFLGLMICFCGKIRKYRMKSAKTILTFNKKGRVKGKLKYTSTRYSSSEVSIDPGLGIFYLNSLGIDLEQRSTCLKQSTETGKISSNQSSKEVTKLEADNASNSSTRYIMSIHEDVDSARSDSDDGNSSLSDKIIIPMECHSSDAESFHFFVDSHSSNVRLSNASAGRLSDTSEIPLNISKISPSPQQSSAIPSMSQEMSGKTRVLQPQSPCSRQDSPDCQKSLTPPAPTSTSTTAATSCTYLSFKLFFIFN